MRDYNEGSKEGPHRYAREYDEEYYLDSDGHLQCYADLSVSGSGSDVDSPGTTPRKATDESDPGGETDNSGSLKEELIALLLSGTRVKRGFTMRKQGSGPNKNDSKSSSVGDDSKSSSSSSSSNSSASISVESVSHRAAVGI